LVLSQVACIEPSDLRAAAITFLHAGKLFLIIRLDTDLASPFGAAPIGAVSSCTMKNKKNNSGDAYAFHNQFLSECIECGQKPITLIQPPRLHIPNPLNQEINPPHQNL
jgi:hypothetical protein